MLEEQVKYVLDRCEREKVTEKYVCEQEGFSYKSLFYYKKKYKLNKYTRGQNPNSVKVRVNFVKDDFFTDVKPLSSYWAGFIAADGNIDRDKKKLTLVLCSKDKDHLEDFNNTIKSTYKIKDYTTTRRDKEFTRLNYYHSHLSLTSRQICKDLENNYNITPNKSLTLKPPVGLDEYNTDCFIKGYLDGDGTIGLLPGKRQPKCYMSVLGTLDVLRWIQYRFSCILGEDLSIIYCSKNRMPCLKVSDKRARTLVLHYSTLTCPGLARKWSEVLIKHCKDYSKFKDLEKHLLVCETAKNSSTQQEAATKLGMSQAAVSWYVKQSISHETKQLDKGEKDLESA